MSNDSENLPSIDANSSENYWQVPQKRIYSASDLPHFHHSLAIQRIKSIIFLICSKIALVDVPNGCLDDRLVCFERTHPQSMSPDSAVDLDLPVTMTPFSPNRLSKPVQSLVKIMNRFKEIMDDTPPFPGPRRYGNMACRDWHDKITSDINNILESNLLHFLPVADDINEKFVDGFIKELKYYILSAFGSRERLDFGTGHELSFISFLGCLVMIGILDPEKVTGKEWLVILANYYDLIKSLILTYTLEPAGSHGVWGLDDHFHLVYVFGASQLVDFSSIIKGEEDHEPNTERRDTIMNHRMGLSPSSVLNMSVLKKYRTKNLYYNAIAFIKMVKTGPFNEHSPLLYNISASKTWEKITRGMIKMYFGEVLSKYPVVQHFYFGGVFYPWINSSTLKPLPETYSNEDDKKEAEKNNESNFRSEAEIAMHDLYKKRDKELGKLLDERKNIGILGRRGKELPGILRPQPAIPSGCINKDINSQEKTSNVSRAEQDYSNRSDPEPTVTNLNLLPKSKVKDGDIHVVTKAPWNN